MYLTLSWLDGSASSIGGSSSDIAVSTVCRETQVSVGYLFIDTVLFIYNRIVQTPFTCNPRPLKYTRNIMHTFEYIPE